MYTFYGKWPQNRNQDTNIKFLNKKCLKYHSYEMSNILRFFFFFSLKLFQT